MRQLLQKIREMDGEGTLAEMRFLEESAEQAMVEQFSAQARSGYDRVIRRGMELMQKKPDSRELGRLQRDLEQAQRAGLLPYRTDRGTPGRPGTAASRRRGERA